MDYGDYCLLDYIKDFIPEYCKDLYQKIMDYNSIYANNFTINRLFEMGKKDPTWTEKAEQFIKKYNISKSDYDKFDKFYQEYCSLKDELFDVMGIDLEQIAEHDDIPEKGLINAYMETNLEELNETESFTVARVLNYCYCVELHYIDGKATIEYGTKILPDYWESEIENITWFSPNMSEDALFNKLFKLFKKHFKFLEKQTNIKLYER